MNDRVLTGSGAVGAAAVVILYKSFGWEFTTTELSVLAAGAGALTMFIASVVRHWLGMEKKENE